jgi:hypothetical protein
MCVAPRTSRGKATLTPRTAAEEQAELEALDSANRARKIAHEKNQIERFSIGQSVKGKCHASTLQVITNRLRFCMSGCHTALVISVDPHSETLDLSLNNNRLRGIYTTHKLGLCKDDKPAVPVYGFWLL